MPTEAQYIAAADRFADVALELGSLLGSARSIMADEPLFGGLVVIHTTLEVQAMHEQCLGLAVETEGAGVVAAERAVMIRIWRDEELAFRSAYLAWQRACHDAEVASALASAEAGLPIDPVFPPEPGGRPQPAAWADLQLPAFL